MANTTGKKFGGRQKGTPNKLTKELRSALKDVPYEFINSEYYFLKQNDEVYVKPDKASLAFDFGILRNIGSIALLATTLLLIFR